MGKFRFQRKHILPLILIITVILCSVLTIAFSIQANRISNMEQRMSDDMKRQTDYLVHACNDLLNNLDADAELVRHFIVQLQTQFGQLYNHTLLYKSFSDAQDGSTMHNIIYNVTPILGNCSIIVSRYDSMTTDEQERFMSFLMQFTEQILHAFSYQNEAADINEQFDHVMAGLKQLDQYMEENNIYDYFTANINGLGQ